MKTPITFSNLYNEKYRVDADGVESLRLVLPQGTYNELYDMSLEDVEGVEIDKTKDRPFDKEATVLGMKIKLDNSMEDGTWRIEK